MDLLLLLGAACATVAALRLSRLSRAPQVRHA
jgi:hypothetical protein